MTRSNKEDVFDEPWMKPRSQRQTNIPPPLPDQHAMPDSYDSSAPGESEMEHVLHSIYSEPHLADNFDADETELAQLIQHERAGSSPLALAGVVLLVALLAGPVSILGTMTAGNRGYIGSLYLVAGGPVIEEMMKLGGLLYLLEKRPWYITHGWQIVVAACVSAFLFGIIENLVYGGIYLAGLSNTARATLMEFRWSVTVLLHTGATFIGAMGLRKAWQKTIARGRLFDSQIAEPYIAAAVIIHGGYNALSLLFGNFLTGE